MSCQSFWKDSNEPWHCVLKGLFCSPEGDLRSPIPAGGKCFMTLGCTFEEIAKAGSRLWGTGAQT